MLAQCTIFTLDVVPLAVTGGVVLLLLGLIQLYLGLKAQKGPRVTGEQTMIGQSGIIRKAAGFRNRSIVEIRGELWWCVPATGRTELQAGSTVKVVGIAEDTMILQVDNTE